MTENTSEIRTLDDLRKYVHRTLCEWENILLDQFGLNETGLLRGGQKCGLQFWVQGPRNVRLEAIWETDKNVVFFFDARGNRFSKIQLVERIARAA